VQPIFECSLRVHAGDTDSAGKLKVSSVFNHIQNAAAIHAGGLGAGIEQILKQGMFWVLSWARLEFASFPTFADEFSLKTWPKCRHKLFSIRDFLFSDKSGEVFCRATTAWLLVDVKTKKAKSPGCLADSIPYQEGEHALRCYPERLSSRDDCTTVFTRRIRYSDLDVNRHVNNARYTEYLMDCYGLEHHRRHRISSLTVSFVAEAKYDDEIDLCLVNHSSDRFTHFIEARTVGSQKPLVQALVEWTNLQKSPRSPTA
jgi:medium-chain acyl-[acyl-carrier-protein] hydrolase